MMARNWKYEQSLTATGPAGFSGDGLQTTTATTSIVTSGGARAAKGYALPRMTREVVELFQQQGATIPNSRLHSHRVSPTSTQFTNFDSFSNNVSMSNSSSPSKVFHNRIEVVGGSPRPSKMQKRNNEKPESWAAYKATTPYVPATKTGCANTSRRPDTTNVIARQMIGSALGLKIPKKENTPDVGWTAKSAKTESEKAQEQVTQGGYFKDTTKATHILPPSQLISTPSYCHSQGRPETTDVVARRLIGAALGLTIPKKGDEKTVAMNKAMRLRRLDERLAAWGEYKGPK